MERASPTKNAADEPGTQTRIANPVAQLKTGSVSKLYDLLRLNFALFPGIIRPQCAHFLRPHYERRAREQGIARILLNAVIFVVFQFWLSLRVRSVARKWGKDSKWIRNSLEICRARFVDPNDIALFRIENPDELDHYMRRFEHIAIGRTIAHAQTDHSKWMTDKLHFYQLCASAGISHPTIHAYDAESRLTIRHLPRGGDRLFIKPACGSGGRGAMELDVPAGADVESWLHQSASHLRKQIKGWDKDSWIFQRRVLPHRNLADLCGQVLPTARFITIQNEQGYPEIVSTVLRFPAHFGTIVDNIGLGGLSAPIALQCGTLGAACVGMRPGECDRHPESGAEIAGRRLPHWPESCDIVLQLHSSHFADHVMVGWDVGISDEGPVMLEANARPSIILAQRAPRMPVGRTRMGELIAYQLDQRAREKSSAKKLLL